MAAADKLPSKDEKMEKVKGNDCHVEFVLVQPLNGYGNVEKLLKVNPVTFLLLAILFACNSGTILQFYDDSFKINELNCFICHS